MSLLYTSLVGATAPIRVDAVGIASGERKVGFTAITPATSGVHFSNAVAQARSLTNSILLDGSGVACGDVDGDGRTDVFFCGLDTPNALYRNHGNWRFEDVAASAGVACTNLDATGAALVDLDGDRDLDLVLNTFGQGTHLFINDGKGRFTTSPHGPLNDKFGGTSLALADVDGNGTLDLYIANYRTVTIRDQPNTKFNVRMVGGQPQVTSINGRPLTAPDLTNRFTFVFGKANGAPTFANEENGEPDGLYLNDGKGRFTHVPFTSGRFLDEEGRPLASPPFDWGLSVMMRDLDGDNDPDIYVCNDFKQSPDRIWMNNGKGIFRAIALHAIRQTSLFSMGVDVADVNRDGLYDIFVVDMLGRSHRMRQRVDFSSIDPGPLRSAADRAQTSRNTLLLARGDGTFAEVAQFAGIEASDWSWTPIFLDVDLDGYEDLLISNGYERDSMHADVAARIRSQKSARRMSSEEQLALRSQTPRLDTANVAFRNLRNGRFEDASDAWNFNQTTISKGMALADLDNDGDLDIAINNFNAAASLLRNEATAPRISVRLRGLPPNTHGIGATITVVANGIRQTQEMISGGRYQSSDDPIRTFAAGTNRTCRIEVLWPGGLRSVLADAIPNSTYTIDQSFAIAPAEPATVKSVPLFEDVSSLLKHQHTDIPFDDFKHQPLASLRLSEFGPGVGWFDANEDGYDDVIIASGRGDRPAMLQQDGRGGFTRVTNVFTEVLPHDRTSVLGFRTSDGQLGYVESIASQEETPPIPPAVRQVGLRGAREIVGPQAWSPGPMALADVDSDGALDLFVGGRNVPDSWPMVASSLLLRQAGGRFVIDGAAAAVLTNVGLASGALFSDITGDAALDLVVACEWGPVKIFENRSGSFQDVTRRLGMDRYRGLWTSVTAGDFDGDGRIDLAVGNWGQNTRYQSHRSKPIRLYAADYDGNAVVEVLESYYDTQTKRYVPARQMDILRGGLPFIQARYSSHEAFAAASAEELLGELGSAFAVYEAEWLESSVFLNRGATFEVRALPAQAQFAPAFGLCVADFDGDGNEDLFVAQNCYGTSPDVSRHDAGAGLLLSGRGDGTFTALSVKESGIAIHGDQRGAGVSDYNRDGRVDLLVGQHRGGTRLFQNRAGRPGIRVRLRGGAANPDAIGAVIRLGNGAQWGAAREIHCGSGYLSQDSAMQVFAKKGELIQVRWPNGKFTVSRLPAEAAEVEITRDGGLTIVR